jgi:translocation and assembly module TamA
MAIHRKLTLAASLALCLTGFGSHALDRLEFSVAGEDEKLNKALRAASGLLAAEKDKRTAALDLFSDARAEYGRLLTALYAKGHYSAVIHVLIDGREAATIAPLDAPSRIGQVVVTVDPGPEFAFSRATVAPLPTRTALPDGFEPGQVAGSEVIREAAQAGVDGWRGQGFAKAAVSGQNLVADHGNATLNAAIEINPGPRLRFGPLTVTGLQRLRPGRALAIAGLPEGDIYDPADVARATERLRRTGVFSSVAVTEDETITPPDLIGINVAVAEAPLRRYTFGAEIESYDGVILSGSWLHRNLLGGGERLEITGEIVGIGAQTGGTDYRLGATLDRPAAPWPDTLLTLSTDIARIDDVDKLENTANFAIGFTQFISDTLEAHGAIGYAASSGKDAAGSYSHHALEFPFGLTWDRRDNKTDATRLFYLDIGAKPFYGFANTSNGAQLTLDARAYKGFGAENGLILAARLQGGAVFGASILGTPRESLFYSGGGGTVRGQPYQSLGVTVDDAGTPVRTGGNRFLAASLEARTRITSKIGAVGFLDMGLVGDGSSQDWHAGAGLGLRYATGIGPLRIDLAVPLREGHGLQAYVGLGQSF